MSETGRLICRIRGAQVSVGTPPESFVLDVPAFDLREGDRIALVSPSGSGKSLFLEVLALIRAPSEIAAFEYLSWPRVIDVAALWRHGASGDLGRQRRRGIGFLLQTGGLLPFLTVAENVALPARLAGQDWRAAVARLEGLGLDGLRNRLPKTLSAGERQRAALARAVSAMPCLLLADEPTAALDPRNADRVMALLNHLILDGLVKALVIATHDAHRARAYGFSILTLETSDDESGARSVLEMRELAA